MKKIISLFLALLMVFSLALPTFAVSEENQKLSEAQVRDALNTAVAALVDAPEDATVIVSDELADEIADKADTPKEISGLLSGYLFIEKEKAEEVAADIVANVKYTVKVIDGGVQTVYCSIDFEKFPEIFDLRVYRSAIKKLQDKCSEFAKENGIDIEADSFKPMSYSHIAGELALHIILARLSVDTADWNPVSQWIYEHSSIADLNVDEARFPVALIEAMGDIFVNLIDFILLLIG